MRLLIDTHCFLWMHVDPDRIERRVRRRLEDGRTERYLSAASGWEIAIKAELGKLELPSPALRFVRERLDELRVRPLAIELEDALDAAALPRHHLDPFDRMLVAQARRAGLTLVTADRQLEPYDVRVLWAR